MSVPKESLPLRMISNVVRGFQRGSTDLGIPTANLDRESGKFAGGSFDDLPTGIYWGFCRIGVGEDSCVYKTACSIGYNPTYNNTLKTVGKSWRWKRLFDWLCIRRRLLSSEACFIPVKHRFLTIAINIFSFPHSASFPSCAHSETQNDQNHIW